MPKLQVCLCAVAIVCFSGIASADEMPNIAFQKICRFPVEQADPKWGGSPSEAAAKLTDGSYATSYFPTSTTDNPNGWVGWDFHNISGYVTITVDLGSVSHITGAMLHTAAYDGGSFSNDWPAAIVVLVSNDTSNWRIASELVSQSASGTPGLPSLRPSSGPGSDWAAFPSGYEYSYRTVDTLSNYGRYVRFVIASSGHIYVDELEVYGTANQNGTPSGESVTAVDNTFVQKNRVRTGAIRRIVSDAKAVQTKTNADLSMPISSALAIPLTSISDPTGFSTRLPLTIASNLHAQVFSALASYWHNQGKPDLVVWQPASPWDPMGLTDDPTGDEPSLSVAKMDGEYRCAAFNLTNTTSVPMDNVSVTFDGTLGANPSLVNVQQVVWTDTSRGIPIASAIEDVSSTSPLNLLPGLTRQVWLTFPPSTAAPGTYSGDILIDGVSHGHLELRVWPVVFPSEPALGLGGWDYLDMLANNWTIHGAMTPTHRAALITYLRQHLVTIAWAHQPDYDYEQYSVMPLNATAGTAPGNRFDEWLSLWNVDTGVPPMKGYYVSLPTSWQTAYSSTIQSSISAYANHWWSDEQLDPSLVSLLLFDEPGWNLDILQGQCNQMYSFATAVRGANYAGAITSSHPNLRRR